MLLFVDFWETSRWRAHGAMANWLRQANIEMQSIAPREILMDYKFFDPHAHFRAWRATQSAWTDRKLERIEKSAGPRKRTPKTRQQLLKNRRRFE